MVTNTPNGYKKTIAGVIPEHWDAKLIKNFANVVRVGSPRPAGSPLYFNGDFIPWITVADVTRDSDVFLRKTKTMLTEEGSKRTRIIEPDTLLLTNSGATLGVPKISLIRAGANDGIAMILDPKGILKEYLYYFLSSKTLYFRERLAPGLGQPNLNTDIIGTVAVPIPPIEEQKEIIRVLEEQNVLIEKTEALIRAKQQQFSWLATKLINGSDHHKALVGDVIHEVSERNRSETIERVLSVTNHSGFVLPEDQFERRVASADISNYKIVQRGQYAYNPSRINVGSIARLDNWDDGVLSPMYVVFALNEKKADSDYFLHWLSSSEAKQRIKNSAQGSVRETVSFGDLGSIPISLPTLPEQQRIAHTLNTAQAEIRLLQQLAKKYRTQKRGLMQKLLTGEWRVGVDKEAAA